MSNQRQADDSTMAEGVRARTVLAVVTSVVVGCSAGCQTIGVREPPPQGTTPAAEATGSPDDGGGAASVGLEGLNATLWVQTAVEYRASALQAYELARRMLDEALADPSWTAAVEQTGDFADLPPAVIVDVDETVLDNSAYQARLILDRDVFGPETWNAWVEEGAAAPVPGALEFCRRAAERGITVFYVTNRRAHLEEATRGNLAALGFPVARQVDTVLSRGEIQAWDTSDKAPRRRAIAHDYRILLLLGDNLGDFVPDPERSVTERRELLGRHRDAWGSRWIVLPNPQYGSWEGAILGFDYSRPWQRALGVKRRALDPGR